MIRRRNISVPIVAMSDIAFLLLVFLMVTSLTSSKKNTQITLPQIVKADKINVKKRINIFINEFGKCYLNDKEVIPEQLKEKLETQTAFNKSAVIFIYADKDTEYQKIDEFIKILQSVSLRNCVFVTKKQVKSEEKDNKK